MERRTAASSAQRRVHKKATSSKTTQQQTSEEYPDLNNITTTRQTDHSHCKYSTELRAPPNTPHASVDQTQPKRPTQRQETEAAMDLSKANTSSQQQKGPRKHHPGALFIAFTVLYTLYTCCPAASIPPHDLNPTAQVTLPSPKQRPQAPLDLRLHPPPDPPQYPPSHNPLNRCTNNPTPLGTHPLPKPPLLHTANEPTWRHQHPRERSHRRNHARTTTTTKEPTPTAPTTPTTT